MRVETRRVEGYDLMEYYGEVTGATGASSSFQDPSGEWRHHLQHADSGLEEAVWQLNLHQGDEMEEQHLSTQYPERPGQPDCDYYMRTGMCSFGISCRYNHPSNWKLAAAIARSRGEYPERPGQPECQYFLKTGTCKFGSTCKYHHPREKAGSAGRVQLNVIGYPLRPGEKECAYYMRTGACKYGVTCKFHHPQPTPVSPLMPGSPLYSSASPSATHQPYGWPLRSPYLLSPRVSPSGYQSLPMLVPPQGMVSVPPAWTTYQQQGPGSPLASPEGGAGILYSPPGDNATLQSGGSPLKDSFYPERPGQPDCQYYLRTGDCKFGPACRYHHPKDKAAQQQQQGSLTFNNQSLPQRPGAPTCTYYARNGLCKFGSACRYDHPLGNMSYSPSTSSLADMPVAPYPTVSSPSSTPTPDVKQASLAPEEHEEIVLGSVTSHEVSSAAA